MAGIGNLASGYAPQSMTWQQGMTSPAASGGGGDGGFDTLLGSTLSGLSSWYGSQNAAEAQNHGYLAGIGTQNQTMGNINSLFSGQAAAGNNAFGQLGTTNPFATQQGAGNNAFTQLGKLQGANGAAPDYSGFENSPGYKFALEQGQNAIRSQAAANGSAYTPNTLANIGKFVTGTASQNYNNYVSQLMETAGLGAQGNSGQSSQMLGTAGLGAQGNSALAEANLRTGGNISQLQANSGKTQASGMAGSAGAVGGLLGSILGGKNGSGVVSAIGSGLGAIGRGIGNMFGGGGYSDPSSPYNTVNTNPYNGGNSVFGNGSEDYGNFISSQYSSDNSAPVQTVDPNSLSNPYGNMDFSNYNFDTGDFGNP